MLNIYKVNPDAAKEIMHAHIYNRVSASEKTLSNCYSKNYDVSGLWQVVSSQLIAWEHTRAYMRPNVTSQWLCCNNDWSAVNSGLYSGSLLLKAIQYGKVDSI
jgi:hypothetical protein